MWTKARKNERKGRRCPLYPGGQRGQKYSHNEVKSGNKQESPCSPHMHTVQQRGQEGKAAAPKASTVLAEDDRLSLTALRAVTSYCITFPEGQQGEHGTQSPDEWARRHTGTARNQSQPLQLKLLLETPAETFPLCSAKSQLPMLRASKILFHSTTGKKSSVATHDPLSPQACTTQCCPVCLCDYRSSSSSWGTQ